MKAITTPQPLARSRLVESDSSPSPFRAIVNPFVDIVVPVLNEEKILQSSIETLDEYMMENLPYRYQITIADNGSQDKTLEIANSLAQNHQSVRVVRLAERGRGRALKQVWQSSQADILTYMDVDLSTSLDNFPPMIQPLVAGEAGVAIGSRLMKKSKTSRGFKREFISRCYNKIIKLTSRTKFSDAQCGFKAIRRDVAKRFLPKIKDNEWFFDTELLIKTERAGIPIHEQPVTWIEDTDSRVKIVKTAVDDLKGLHRVNKELDNRSWFEKMTLPMLLIATGALYMFGAMHNGMANSYYAAAVQAASQNWTAWLFGSLDAANYVSIDKPPLATMIMGFSARLFGFSSFSMLLPSVLAGIGSVWLLYSAMKRQFGFTSAIISAVTLMLTPVAALMFGFNNPDAILTFMLTASGYAFLRSLEGKRPLLWLSLAGLFTGLAFNTKMLQGLMVLPAMVIVYLIFAKPPIVTRFLHLMFAGVITTVSTLWWSVLVWLTPSGNRPWVGSTNDNSIWSLIFGYNGFGRLLGNRGGGGGGTPPSGTGMAIASPGGMGGAPSGGHGPGGTGFGGQTGIFRIFNNDFGPNIAWLLILALASGGLLLWILRKTPRTNRGRAAVIFWILWLIIHIVIFSMTSGVIHPYYVVVMAPAVAALVGIGVPFLWGAYVRRKSYAWILPMLVGVTAVIAIIILSYAGTTTWLMWTVGILGAVGMAGLLANLYIPKRWLQNLAIITSVAACMTAPVVYAMSTVNVTHTGSIPTAGPSSTAMQGSNNEKSQADSALVEYLLKNQNGATWLVAVDSANESAAIQLTSGQPVMAIGGFNGSDTPLTLERPNGGNSEITNWIKKNGKVVNYGGSDVTLYELSA